MALPIKGLEDALIRFLAQRGIAAVEITDLDTDSRQEGWCDTCAYTQMIVEIWYKIESGAVSMYEYEGGLGSFLSELTDE